MADPETTRMTLVDRMLHRPGASERQVHEVHATHAFVSGHGGTHPTGRGAGGWVWLDDSYLDAHVCKACGRPESDPIHAPDIEEEG